MKALTTVVLLPCADTRNDTTTDNKSSVTVAETPPFMDQWTLVETAGYSPNQDSCSLVNVRPRSSLFLLFDKAPMMMVEHIISTPIPICTKDGPANAKLYNTKTPLGPFEPEHDFHPRGF